MLSSQIVFFFLAEDVATTVREEEMQRLKQFDLDWRFGPCTGNAHPQHLENTIKVLN